MNRLITASVVLISASALAYQTEVVDGIEWKYEDCGDVVRLYAYYDSQYSRCTPCIPADTVGDVVVPEILGGKTVAGIRSCAFRSCSKITSVRIGSNVGIVNSGACWDGCHRYNMDEGDGTFWGCTALTNIDMTSSSIWYVGHQAFHGCTNLKKIEFPNVQLWWHDYKGATYSEYQDGGTFVGSHFDEIIFRGTLPHLCKHGYPYDEISLGEGAKKIYCYTDTTPVISQDWLDFGAGYVKSAVPVISPMSCTFSGSISITITASEVTPTKIFYTIDDSVPATNSISYKKFRLYGKTTVKAIACSEGMLPSDVVMNSYALGYCTTPVISPASESVFQHSDQEVSIDWNEDDGTLYYTIDGCEPTTNSLIYAGPFSIDETTTIKAKVFSDKYFDSEVVTATLTREWVKVAQPTINSLDTFTGTKCLVTISCADVGATIYYTTDGSDPTTSSKQYDRSFYVTATSVIKAFAVKDDYTDSLIAEKTITIQSGVGDVLGSPDVQFVMGGNAGWIEDTSMRKTKASSMKSADDLQDGQTSEMSATVKGVGTVQFYWRTSCEDSEGQYDWDHAEFYADDKVYKIDAESNDWVAVSHTFSAYGTHTLRWVYTKDSAGKEGSDCAWVSDLVLDFDPIPDMGANPSADDIASATFGSADTRIVERVTDAAEYNRYQQWASGVEGSTKQQIKDSGYSWLSFALDAKALLTTNPKDGDISVSSMMPTSEAGVFELDVSVAGIAIGEKATAANLAQVFSVEGATEVNGEYSSENVSLVFGTPEDGKVKVIVGSKDETEESFFMKVKMNP